MAGAGTIRRKGNGWEVRVSVGRGLDGKHRQVSRYVTGERADAEAALLRLRLELGDGHAGRGENTTVGHLLTTWLSLAQDDLSPTTFERYRDIVRLHLIPTLGATALRKLDPPTLDRLYRDIVRSGLSPRTVRQVNAVLRRACNEAMRWGWITANPASLARPPRVTKREIQPPTTIDVIRLVEAARAADADFGDFLALAAVTGARRGELCGLQWGDVDHAAGMLTIRRAIVETDHGLVEKTTKTHQARRLALDASTLDLLSARELRCKERAFAVGKRLGPWIFGATVDQSTPIPPDRMTGRFVRLRASLGLPAVRLHDLRHYMVTTLLDAGVPIRNVAGRAGHGDSSTTINLYAHALEQTDRHAADLLGASLARGR